MALSSAPLTAFCLSRADVLTTGVKEFPVMFECARNSLHLSISGVVGHHTVRKRDVFGTQGMEVPG